MRIRVMIYEEIKPFVSITLKGIAALGRELKWINSVPYAVHLQKEKTDDKTIS